MSTTPRDSPLGSQSALVEVLLAIDTKPGIGVELESSGIVMKNPEQGVKIATYAELYEVKGAPFEIEDNEDANALSKGPDWNVTAEYDGPGYAEGIARLRPEIIINGKRVKLGTNKLQAIGTEIIQFMNLWRPHIDQKIWISGFEKFGPWKLSKPSVYSPESVTFSVQVTAAASLSTVQEYFQWAGKKPYERPNGPSRARKTAIRHYHGGSRLFLGGGIYIMAAYREQASEGPKSLLPIMPRTDLATIYKRFVEPSITALLGSSENSLYEMVKVLANANADPARGEVASFDIDNTYFKWDRWEKARGTAPSGAWPEAEKCFKDGELPIRIWLRELQYNSIDVMALMDSTLRHGQLGGLGSRLELLLTKSEAAPYSYVLSSEEAPIWEFRDLSGVNVNKITQTLKECELSIIRMHLAQTTQH